MPDAITLTITEGSLKGKEFTFTEPARCILGRAEGCNPRLPSDDEHRSVSRLHCLLDVDPPFIRVRDIGSRNGTFVNGENIGHRAHNQHAEEAMQAVFCNHELTDGDELQVGNTVFRVTITEAVPESDDSRHAEPALAG
jgi:pSer/pThr/pTyr-binding forkhead associated (FHA) protein